MHLNANSNNANVMLVMHSNRVNKKTQHKNAKINLDWIY